MQKIADSIPGYDYDTRSIPKSSVTLQELEALKVTAGFTDEDVHFLRMAGDVLQDQTEAIVLHWRSGIIAGIPNLARHSRSLDNEPLPDYLAKSNLRFRQWILDTCFREYDQEWLNYQEEIAVRHTSLKKNAVDGVESTPFVPYRDIVAFVPVLNETIRPYLIAKGHPDDIVTRMHLAWQRSLQLQIALWSKIYMGLQTSEW
ncbi:protoglobin domain-containing protein [Terriglobus roseus]|uniref:Protoglobin n=1 Tax=Terriglobus roseus TaxID=392734 RepID=A0A1G7GRV1_9BACT|nr:protoglobin domain-containing protein [Terriglobus roseus]SDE90821.1 Protoglobin [Terriglobus roseus]